MKKVNKKTETRGRPSKAPSYLIKLRRLGIFRLKDARKAGIPQQTLSRLVADDKIIRIEQGLYRHPDTEIDPATEDFTVACANFGGEAAVGGLTALFQYHLTIQAPQQIWLIVPPEKYTRDTRYRCIRTKTSLNIGIVKHSTYRIVTIERAIAEGFRFATKIGLETAIGAARTAFRDKLTTPAKLLNMARRLEIDTYVKKHWEAITVE